MKLSIENLKRGIKWWQERKWPSDYHNRDYYKIYQDRADGLTEYWLTQTVDRIAEWGALRYPKPGVFTKASLLASMKTKLLDLRTEYQRILNLSRDEPSIETVSWRDIEPLYEMMADFKNTKYRSPVFPSKLGHFIFPKVFIVMDGLGMELMPYDYFWQGTVNELNLFADKCAAIDLLKNEIAKNSFCDIHCNFPLETRVMELCHVGDKWKWIEDSIGPSHG